MAGKGDLQLLNDMEVCTFIGTNGVNSIELVSVFLRLILTGVEMNTGLNPTKNKR